MQGIRLRDGAIARPFHILFSGHGAFTNCTFFPGGWRGRERRMRKIEEILFAVEYLKQDVLRKRSVRE